LPIKTCSGFFSVTHWLGPESLSFEKIQITCWQFAHFSVEAKTKKALNPHSGLSSFW